MPEGPRLLPPSMRPQKRYVVFEAISEQPVVYGDLVAAVWNSMISFLGELGSADARLWFIHNIYQGASQRGVIKCSHTAVEQVRAVLSLVTIVGETKALIRVVGVTGTIKSAKTKYLGLSE